MIILATFFFVGDLEKVDFILCAITKEWKGKNLAPMILAKSLMGLDDVAREKISRLQRGSFLCLWILLSLPFVVFNLTGSSFFSSLIIACIFISYCRCGCISISTLLMDLPMIGINIIFWCLLKNSMRSCQKSNMSTLEWCLVRGSFMWPFVSSSASLGDCTTTLCTFLTMCYSNLGGISLSLPS